ncbi:transposase [bacterium]|nr:transposase [bacterium]
MKQLSLFREKYIGEHGGQLQLNKRKKRRPLAQNKPVHLILKSQIILQIGGFKTQERILSTLLSKYSKTYYIKIYETAVCSNHIHICLQSPNPESFKNFLRTLTGQIAFQIKQKFPEFKSKAFWEVRPYTKVISWGQQLNSVLNYIERNRLEASGWIQYKRS